MFKEDCNQQEQQEDDYIAVSIELAPQHIFDDGRNESFGTRVASAKT